jgi:hypothetical protein
MATAKKAGGSTLSDIKKRLRAGTVSKADLKKISKMITAAERSVKSLRAAVIE